MTAIPPYDTWASERHLKAQADGQIYVVHFHAMGTTSLTKKMHLHLKSTSPDKHLFIRRIVVSSDDAGTPYVSLNAAITGGTAKTPVNLNCSSANVAEADVMADPTTATGGNDLEHFNIQMKDPFEFYYAGGLCLGDGNSIGVGFKSENANKDYHVSIYFYYLPK